MDTWNKNIFGNAIPKKAKSQNRGRYKPNQNIIDALQNEYAQMREFIDESQFTDQMISRASENRPESNPVKHIAPWRLKKVVPPIQPIFPQQIKTPKSSVRIKSQSKSHREYLPKRDFISIETNHQVKPNLAKFRASAFPIHEKSLSRDKFQDSSVFDLQEKSQFSATYHDVLDQFEERKNLKLALPAITAFSRSVERERDGPEIFSYGNPKPRDRGKEAQLMMLPMRNAYLKVIKKQKQGIEVIAEVKESAPAIETNSESSHLMTEPANMENAELVSQLNQTVVFESTEWSLLEAPTPEPESQVEIPEALSYMRESLPKSSSSEKSSHTESGDSIVDPVDIEERRKLQEELLTVSGLMEKSMITNHVLDSLDIQELLKSVDFKASQVLQKSKVEPIIEEKDKISVMSDIISVDDLPEAMEVTPRHSTKQMPEDKHIEEVDQVDYQTHSEINTSREMKKRNSSLTNIPTHNAANNLIFSETGRLKSIKIEDNPLNPKKQVTHSMDMRGTADNLHLISPPMWKSQHFPMERSQSDITDEVIKLQRTFQEDKSESIVSSHTGGLSITALLNFIASHHPVNPLTNEPFQFWESVTIEGYYTKLAIGCSCLKKNKKGQRVQKPQELDVTESDSESDDEEKYKGLTKAASHAGQGAVLYLQTMKTFAILFMLLSILNAPVYYMLRESQYLSITGLVYEEQIYSTPELRMECPTENHYMTELNQIRFGKNRRLQDNNSTDQIQNATVQNTNETIISNETEQNLNETVNSTEVLKNETTVNNTESIGNEISQNETNINGTETFGNQTNINATESQGNVTSINSTESLGNQTITGNETQINSTESLGNETSLNATVNETQINSTKSIVNETNLNSTESLNNETTLNSTESLKNETILNSTESLKNDTNLNSTDSLKNETNLNSTETQQNGTYLNSTESSFNETNNSTDSLLSENSTLPLNETNLNLTQPNQPKPPSFLCLLRLNTSMDLFNSSFFLGNMSQALNTSVTILDLRNGSVIVEYEVEGNETLKQKHTQKVMKGEIELGGKIIDFGYKGEKMLIKDGIVKGKCRKPEWNRQFANECVSQSKCQMEMMEDPDCQVDLIMTATCRQNQLFVPLLGLIPRESFAIILVCFDLLGIFLMAFVFNQLKSINSEYCEIMDKHQLSVKNFAIECQKIKCDKHTLDPVVLKMKLWLYYTRLVEPFKNQFNDYQILDITFNTHQKSEQIAKMTQIQQKIEKLSKKNFLKYQDDIEDLNEIFTKQKQRYSEKMSLVSSRRRDLHIQNAYITFKNNLKGNIIESFEKNSEFLNHKIQVEKASEPDEIIWEKVSGIPLFIPTIIVIAALVLIMYFVENEYIAFASIIGLNGLIQTFLRSGNEFHTTTERNTNSLIYIFVMEFLNTGLLVLIYKFNWPFEIENFAIILILALVTMCVTSNIFDISRYFMSQFIRLKDRGFKLNLKLNPDDDFDDQANTKKVYQEDLNNLYLGPDFNSEKKLSRAFSFLFITLFYSSCLPCLYLICFLFLSLTYFTNKFLLLGFYQRSENRALTLIAFELFKYAIGIKILVGYYVYSHQVFQGLDSMQLPGSLKVVQEKVPKVKVHQKVYIAAVVLMVVYIAVGKFFLRFVKAVWGMTVRCMKAIEFRVSTSCFYIFVAKNFKAISNKLKKCFRKERAVSQNQPSQSVEQPLVHISETCSLDEARQSSLTIVQMMAQQIAQDMKKQNQRETRNFLKEIQINSLYNLYHRSLIEYKEFKAYFKQPVNFNIFHSNDMKKTELLQILYQNNLLESDYNLYDDLLRQRIESIQRVIESHFKIIKPIIYANKKAKRDRDLAEVHAREKSLIKALRNQIKEDFNNDEDLQFDQYDFDRMLSMLKCYQLDLQDSSRKLCRIKGSKKQSYFIFDGSQIYLDAELQKSFDSECPDSIDDLE